MKTSNTHSCPENDTFFCAVIDGQGNEIPITEAMIQQACQALDKEDNIFMATKQSPCAANKQASAHPAGQHFQ